jgi:hypothetical protein
MKNLKLRIDDELHARVTETARQDKRSLNSEILVLLSEALSERSYNHPPVEGQS